MFVKPREGLKVRHPLTKRHIPESGIEVTDDDMFWNRRLRSGDVVLVAHDAVAVAEPEARVEDAQYEPQE